MIMENFNKLNTREMQAYAALCLAKYCASINVIHESIEALIEHLLSILVSESLPNWEQKGACLDITGRGDPIPQNLESIIPRNHLETFSRLVEYVVEVGIVDMYGANTKEPLRFLYKCTELLKSSGIDPPIMKEIGILPVKDTENVGWGDTIGQAEYNKIIGNYRKLQLR